MELRDLEENKQNVSRPSDDDDENYDCDMGDFDEGRHIEQLKPTHLLKANRIEELDKLGTPRGGK